MKFKDMCQSFWDTYGKLTKEEVKDNKTRLTAAWQPYQGFEAPVAHIETCLVYGHVAKKVIPDKDLTNALFIIIKRTGCY